MNPNRNDPTDTGALSIEQKTQAALLKSDSLLAKVLKNEGSELRNTSWFKKFNGDTAAAKDDFLDNYSVTPLAEPSPLSHDLLPEITSHFMLRLEKVKPAVE